MELALSPVDAAFRDDVRAFIKDNYPAEMRVPNPETDLSKEQMLRCDQAHRKDCENVKGAGKDWRAVRP